MNLLRLYEYTGRDEYRKRALNAFIAFSNLIESNPSGMSQMLSALDFYIDSTKAVVIVSPSGHPLKSEPFLDELRNTYLPNRIIINVEEGDRARQLAQLIPIVKDKISAQGKSVAYVCEQGVCRLPSFTVEDFANQIKNSQSH